jgi:hypothetical protein
VDSAICTIYRYKPGLSIVGAVLTGYLNGNKLVHLKAIYFGENGKLMLDFFRQFLPSVILKQQEICYDRPIYVDGIPLKEINEKQCYLGHIWEL